MLASVSASSPENSCTASGSSLGAAGSAAMAVSRLRDFHHKVSPIRSARPGSAATQARQSMANVALRGAVSAADKPRGRRHPRWTRPRVSCRRSRRRATRSVCQQLRHLPSKPSPTTVASHARATVPPRICFFAWQDAYARRPNGARQAPCGTTLESSVAPRRSTVRLGRLNRTRDFFWKASLSLSRKSLSPCIANRPGRRLPGAISLVALESNKGVS